MPDEGGKKATGPFGASPVTLIILGLALVAGIVLLAFPGILGGGQPGPTAQTPQPIPDASGAAVVTQGTPPGTGESKRTAEHAADDRQSELASFLVRFGRTNPFAPFAAVRAASSTVSGSSASQTGESILGTLQQRASQLQQGNTAANAQGGAAATGQSNAVAGSGGFTLTGIVRLKAMALAIIRQGEKAHIVGVGDALEKTTYSVLSIGEDRVVLVSGGKELELVLRGKKP